MLHMATFADNLKRLRADARLTQLALAAASGVTQANISKYETGEAIPELSSLLKLATGLGVPLDPLVEGLDVKFDVMYQGLRVTATTEDVAVGETPTAGSPRLPDPSLDHILRGFPERPDEDGEGPHEPPSAEAVEKAHAQLRRLASELLAVSARLAARPVAVARNLEPGVHPRNARRRARTRTKHAPKPAAKRR